MPRIHVYYSSITEDSSKYDKFFARIEVLLNFVVDKYESIHFMNYENIRLIPEFMC